MIEEASNTALESKFDNTFEAICQKANFLEKESNEPIV